MNTDKLIARLRERAATQDACGCWSLDRTAADELERLAADNAKLRLERNRAIAHCEQMERGEI